MSTLTNLSDAELDAVNGGFFNFQIGLFQQQNGSTTNQGQTNVSILPIVAATGQGGNQSSSTSQSNTIHN